jgi:L-seryl-tRNA(Ser) seleniumtransferase
VKATRQETNNIREELYRSLPSVDELLRERNIAALAEREGRAMVVDAARAALEELRNGITAGKLNSPGELESRVQTLASVIKDTLRRAAQPSLRSVINATGVVLHTNLGRAPLSHEAIAAIERTAATYSNLEFDLDNGERGKRDVHVDRLFRRLLRSSGGEGSPAKIEPQQAVSTIVVNNNAAAVWLALNTLAAGGEVIVSRGELVEIGGSFRIPDVMAQSNGILREVGTTNKTRIADYERAITDKTKLLLRVHRSNFEITGFTEQPGIEELVALSRARSIPLVEDLGSGALIDPAALGLRGETGVMDSLRAGVDVVTYSGDKMLGGPQAGMLSGRADLIARMRANSLFRALRADKLVYAALEATLLSYVRDDFDSIPAMRMLRLTKETIGERAERFVAGARSVPGLDLKMKEGESLVGAGAAPSSVLPTVLVAIATAKHRPDQLLAELRANQPPIIARIEDDAVVFDLRTVFPEQEPLILQALARVAQG